MLQMQHLMFLHFLDKFSVLYVLLAMALAAQDESWMYILKMLRLFVALELSENRALSLEVREVP